MKKKADEEIVIESKDLIPYEKGKFPVKPRDEFVTLRKWLEENKDRTIEQIIEDDRKLLYGKMRKEAFGGNMDALKAMFNKFFPDMKFEHRIIEDRFTIEARVNEFLSRDYGKRKKNENK